MNEWDKIVEWVKNQNVPEDSEVSLAYPKDPFTKEQDGRLWIDVLSEEHGLEHSDGSPPGDPDGYYDPMVRQYQLVETDMVYKIKLLLKEILDCPFRVDEATVPKAGIDAAPEHQVVLEMSMSLTKRQKVLEYFRRLGGAE